MDSSNSSTSNSNSTANAALIASITSFVQDYMSGYDASHDMHHIQRVVALAQHILASEEPSVSTSASASVSPSASASASVSASEIKLNTNSISPGSSPTCKSIKPIKYDPLTVTLAALLHDVNDRKYAKPNVPPTSVEQVLLRHGASADLARCVDVIVEHVSYSKEVKLLQAEADANSGAETETSVEAPANAETSTKAPRVHVFRTSRALQSILHTHPELAIVQDADRLDAIGAVGIGRTFTYGGAHGQAAAGGQGRSMSDTIDHFTEKLEKLEDMMKTRTGRRLARERTERLRVFRGWWEEEVSIVGA
ncbi:hypothetical protein L228DRAFT_178442 [Xylona heveae TC161]|uniref:HD/PDEase domain-containing protein n=1 Tax=Xylona heveae (strain CBS 132557 / TC161) TaxID=1328760 RepID=A0A165F9T9_XYLHT|nr:hypothetical protein L228DRAFT_178442 [Xylona heveae TC161]KZF20746.1 hypothetical protein L228DRAFT_178442 [Xylona heveae TC161]